MTLTSILSKLRDLNIEIRYLDGKLKINAPEGSLTPELTAELQRHKEELIVFFMDIAADDKAYEEIKPIAIEEDYALSHAQRRLWVLDQLGSQQIAYNIPLAYRLEGSLSVASLRASFSSLVARHESLRTVFVDVEGEPRQKILPVEESGFELDYEDLRDDPHAVERAKRISEQMAGTAFNLSTGPLLRVKLLQIEETSYVFAMSMHHIVSDEWSMQVLFKEVLLLYNAYVSGESNPLRPLSIHYKDYAHWQMGQLSGERLRSDQSYWMDQLSGELPLLELPTDYRRPSVKTYNGDNVSLALDPELSAKLKMMGDQEGVTLFIVLLSTVYVLLYRYTGQKDIIVGTPVAGREHLDLEDQIGFFVNTLALRMQISGEESFKELLGKVKEVSLEGFAHQQYPFDKLVEELPLERDLSRSPLFDIMVVLQNQPSVVSPVTMQGVDVSAAEVEVQTSLFDLTFSFVEHPERIYLVLNYNSDLFSGDRIEQLLSHYSNLLSSLLDDPVQPVGIAEMLSNHERTQLLDGFNATFVDYPEEYTVVDLFEQQVQRTPDHVSIISYQGHFTYRQLNEQANQVAHYLHQHYHDRKLIVGLMMERSPQLIIGILGVLKVGGAYVPIDSAYPIERIEYLLEDCQAPLLLVQDKFKHYNSFTTDTLVIEQILADDYLPSDKPKITTSADDLLYVLYTSGSTGSPKGAKIANRSFVNLLNWYIKLLDLNEEDKNLLVASVSFDLAQKNLFAPLLSGGSLCLMSAGLYDYQQMASDISQLAITVINCAPAAFYPLLEQLAGDYRPVSSLKSVVLGGEAISIPQIDLWLQSEHCQASVFNTYGPTECTDVVSFFRIDKSNYAHLSSVPIGNPIDNVQLFVLDESLSLLPLGSTGELCIGGVCLGEGYFNNEQLTDQQFVEAAHLPGGRVYRSGDLVRRQATGTLEFIGRKDHQVKIRGQRVELGEIESRLQNYPSVARAAVVVKQDQQGGKQLVAYFTIKEDSTGSQEVSGDRLRQYLQEWLPAYMLPGVLVALENLPLTPNGKVDKRSLPEVDQFERHQAYVAPVTNTERQLVEIWQQVLDMDKVGVEDNFFELGGHSLKATQIVTRIYKHFSVKLELVNVFSAPTVREQSLLIDQRQREVYEEIKPIAIEEDYGLSHAQRRLWVLDQLDSQQIAYNIPLAYRLEGSLSVASLRSSFSSLVARHESLRTVFVVVEGEPRQKILSVEESGFELDYEDLRDDPQAVERAKQISEQMAGTAFNLSTGPLLRVKLLQEEEQHYYLLLTIHHIICDGRSIQKMLQELFTLYNAYVSGESSPLRPLSIHYKDYAHWQMGQLSGDRLRSDQSYWMDQLSGELPLLELPTDYRRPSVKTYNGDNVSLALDPGLSAKLKMMGDQEGVTLFMVLLSTVYVLLYRYTGQKDIIVGTPVAGREHLDLEDQIGYYLNTLALRIHLSGEESFKELLDKVKGVSLEGFAHQQYPFDKLVEELPLERDLSRSPLFDIMVVLQNQPSVVSPVTMQGVDVSAAEVEVQTSKFDLTFSFVEQSERIYLVLDYNSDLFSGDRIEQLLSHYNNLLSSLLDDPVQPVGIAEMLSNHERTQLLDGFNATFVDYPEEYTVVDLFEQQVQRTPDHVSIISYQGHFTYRQLNEQANQVAHYLHQHYHDRKLIVGLMMERSPQLIIGILGVLKVGGAYVPIDSAYPIERIEYLLEDCQAPLLLVQDKFKHYNSFTTDTLVIEQILADDYLPSDKPKITTSADDLLYVLYTSGSTGSPKGAKIANRSFVNLLNWYIKLLDLNEEDKNLLVASVSFDLAQKNLFAPLLSGGSLCLMSAGLYDYQQMASDISQLAITVINCAPAAFYPLLEQLAGDYRPVSSLKSVVLGGEAISIPQIDLWLQSEHCQASVFNTYGPTECTDVVSFFRIDKSNYAHLSSVPIGNPIDNVQLFVLDESLSLLPLGSTGELCIGGVCLGEGYFNNEQLTDQQFVEAAHLPGGRVYRSGDLVRRQATGTLEFIGRKDHQVKIRGQRVELGEIESRLQNYPSVARAAVVVKQDQQGGKQLVAYFTIKEDSTGSQEVSGDRLRQYLQEWLPAYMLPGVLVALENLPLTPNGKVDKRSLPEVDQFERHQAYVAPVTNTERQLVEIWQQVLDMDKVGVEDNFFELGGHSLKATQIVTRIYKHFSVKLELVNVFSAPTVREQSLLIDQRQREVYEEIKPIAIEEDYGLSHAQRRLWVLDQLDSQQIAYNIPLA
ncbi:amino acid adenylation domain-containing protein, partial [Fulvivirgaceae bacterium BMA12]|nr:amino acid adenylation domain-containing protein [Fulvivirgaceae bacterium BMA12]